MMTMDNGIEKKRWEDLGLRPLKDHSNPTFGDLSHTTMHIPGVSGTLSFGAEMEGKSGIQINVVRIVKSEKETTQTINALNRFFFDEFKQPRFIKVIYDYEPNKFVWLKIGKSFVPNRATIISKFAIPFEQFDDNRYSIVEANELRWGSREVDFRADYKLGNNGTGADNVQVTGNTTFSPSVEGLALQPFFVLEGSGTNVKISCVGQTITIGSFANAKVEIDTENYAAYFDGVDTNIDFGEFHLIPGEKVSVSGSGMNFSFSIHYRDAYL